jgi:hypothetical protein
MIINQKKDLFFLSISSIIQNIYFKYNKKSYIDYIFTYGVADESQLGYLEILFLFLPVFFALLHFSEKNSKNLAGYGKLLLVRNVSRQKLVLRETISNLYDCIIIYMIQFIISLFFVSAWHSVFMADVFLLMGVYILTMLSIANIQFLGEILLTPPCVNLILNCYILVSMFAKMLFGVDKSNYFYFPANFWESTNRVIEGGAVHSLQLYVFKIVLNICVLQIIVKLFGKKDVI